MRNRKLGIILIFLVCLVTFNLWLLSKPSVSVIFNDPLLSLSQILSLLGVVLISLSLILTTRFTFIEDLFGGLDKVYKVHRLMGGLAFIFVLNHPLLLAAKTASTPIISISYLFPGTNFAYNTGIFALYSFVLSVIFLVFIKLPYHLWKWIHRIMGLGFLLSVIHIFTIGSDIGRFFPLRIWITVTTFLGFVSVFYIMFLYKKFGPKYRYVVEKLERRLDVINIWLKPVKEAIKFDPGQFAYIKFHTKEIGGEAHPYSISTAAYEKKTRLSIKILGDYTLKLPAIKEGDKAEVFGPYGSFGGVYNSGEENHVWIAGGIGVTPFLSMLRNEYRVRSNKQIFLFYCYRNPEEGVFAEEINYLTEGLGNIKFVNWCSKQRGRLDAKKIIEMVKGLPRIQVSLCGPNVMMESFKRQLLKMGVPENNIYYENFQMV